MRTPFRRLLWVILLSSHSGLQAASISEADLCVYGATSGGIVAAIQGVKMGKQVVLLEPSTRCGGLTTGGLGATDIGNKAAIGGLSRGFYQRIARHYSQPQAWRWESHAEYFARRGGSQVQASDARVSDATATQWTFEPHVATLVYQEWLDEHAIKIAYEKRLSRIKKIDGRITEITMEDGSRYRAKMFVDATYEGDLMARARVSYTVGREANRQYGETLNGVREETPKHQFTVAVDPYRKPGNSRSGLLPFIQSGEGGIPGEGDRCLQAYNLRLCFTTNADNRLPLTPPRGYDPGQYELLARYLDALAAAGRKPGLSEFWNPIWMPNGKTDINNNGGFSTDFIGMNYAYPEASYSQRARMHQAHENYIRGFVYFLANDPRVPAAMRQEMQLWGPCRDEFVGTGGWPPQLYVREARRMVSDYVMSEHHCRGGAVAEDAIGLAAYNMDSHNCRRIVKQGRVENEGDVQVPPMKPYPISYRAIVPKAGECGNLLVPICLSATHIAYGSIRMEPVFMILGQSAATAACLAIDDAVAIQNVPYPKLRARLLQDQQILQWNSTP
jgi:hypothetical protein